MKRKYLRCAWRLVQCTVASPLLGVWTRNLSYHIHMGFEGLLNSEFELLHPNIGRTRKLPRNEETLSARN